MSCLPFSDEAWSLECISPPSITHQASHPVGRWYSWMVARQAHQGHIYPLYERTIDPRKYISGAASTGPRIAFAPISSTPSCRSSSRCCRVGPTPPITHLSILSPFDCIRIIIIDHLRSSIATTAERPDLARIRQCSSSRTHGRESKPLTDGRQHLELVVTSLFRDVDDPVWDIQ